MSEYITLPAAKNRRVFIPLAGLPPFVYTYASKELTITQMDFVKRTDRTKKGGSFVGGAQIRNWKVLPNRPGPLNFSKESKAGAVGVSMTYTSDVEWSVFVG